MSKHTEFIVNPIFNILEDAVAASSRIGNGIETYPICDYIMQSILLKMTGFQEQKLKCITWEIATHDYEYRRRLLNNKDNLGEYSSYKAKNKIYKTLCEQIIELNPEYDFNNVEIKKKISNCATSSIKDLFKESNLTIWSQSNFDYFSKYGKSKIVKNTQFLNSKDNLLESTLQEKYKLLYAQRNRIAHNTLSYQQNLPTLKSLLSYDDESRNYFVWFSILVLIDRIFVELYIIYKEVLEEVAY